MALVKSRPRIGLQIPRELRPGEECLVTVVLQCRQPVEVEYVEVVLEVARRRLERVAQLASLRGRVGPYR